MSHASLDQLAQTVRIPEVENADSTPTKLVLISGSDSATGRSDLFAGRALAVDQLVIRKDEVRAIAHVQTSLDVDSIRDELVDFREKRLHIQHHTIANGAADAGVQNSARNLVKNERLVADLHGVPGVGSALIAHDPISALREDIDELAFTLVSPLGTHDDDGARICIEHSVWGAGKRRNG